MTALRSRRLRRTTAGVAAAAAIASGVAFAFFLDDMTYSGNSAAGGSLTITSTLDTALSFSELYPTSDFTTAGDQEQFSITNDNPVDVAYALTAQLDETASGVEGSSQFDDLYVRITDDASGEVLYGDLLGTLDLALTIPAGEVMDLTMAVFLMETGEAQPQGATTAFALSLDVTTVPDAPVAPEQPGPLDPIIGLLPGPSDAPGAPDASDAPSEPPAAPVDQGNLPSEEDSPVRG